MATLLNGEEAARLLLQVSDKCRSSPLSLLWLKLPPDILEKTEIGSLLLSLCKYHRISLHPNKEFFKCVQDRANRLEAVDPKFFTVSLKRNEAIENYRQLLKSRRSQMKDEPFAHLSGVMPFCFQARKSDSNKKDRDSGKKICDTNLFFCFAHAEDGIAMMHRILSEGRYFLKERNTFYYLSQIYEHRYDQTMLSGDGLPNRLSYMMIDWEVLEGQFHGRLSHGELCALCAGFPDWFVGELHRLGFTEKDHPVTGARRARPVPRAHIADHAPGPQLSSRPRAAPRPATTFSSTPCTSSSRTRTCPP